MVFFIQLNFSNRIKSFLQEKDIEGIDSLNQKVEKVNLTSDCCLQSSNSIKRAFMRASKTFSKSGKMKRFFENALNM